MEICHSSQILDKYLFAKFGDHISYRNEILILISILTWILENAEPNALTRHIAIAILLKSETPIHNSEVPDTADRKTIRRGRRRRTTKAIAKPYEFDANALM